MGSQSDWEVMKEAKDQLDELSITNEQLIISAHRTPNRILDYAKKSLENVKVVLSINHTAVAFGIKSDIITPIVIIIK